MKINKSSNRKCWFKLALCLLIGISNICIAQNGDTRMFIFGHSLLDHRPPLIPTPSNETTVPHWLYLLSAEAGYDYAAGGQYGFLPQHANVPPISQWGYDIVPGVWESDTEAFSEADVSTVLITAGNFMQWQGPDEEYPGDPGITPISATETILDWLAAQGDDPKCYIYENWPDMAEYLPNDFPPSHSDFTNYDNYTQGAFHDWWIDYQDALLLSRPDLNVRMIPVGPILGKILTQVIPNQIPYTELYEDNAPHGRASTYFLASLVTFMAIYEEPAPASFSIPSIVHPVIQTNYQTIVNFIWDELNAFNLDNGDSRVFCPNESLVVNVEIFGYLAGAINQGSDFMRTNLRDVNLIPASQPYGMAPFNHFESDAVNLNIPSNVVDWVLVEARTGDPLNGSLDLIESRAGLLLSDGSVVDYSGSGPLKFRNLDAAVEYYFTLRHRNHFDVVSFLPMNVSDGFASWDFRDQFAYGPDQMKTITTESGTAFALIPGDYNGDNVIQTTDYDDWKIAPSILNSYQLTDGNMDGTVQVTDFDIWVENNPKLGLGLFD